MNPSPTNPTILIIIGISGDLARRKLLPAIRKIHDAGAFPEKFRIIGISRRDISVEDVLPIGGDQEYLRSSIEIRQMDLGNEADYRALGEYLTTIEQGFGAETQRIFYLSVPPLASQPDIELMGLSGLSKAPRTKLLIEKPFGTDLETAEELVENIKLHFAEDQVYRIDHYLAKEMTQNLVVFRSSNALFRNTWNKDYIESIDITASEHIGIEGRVAFYEQTGALRDIVQSHLLQLAALTLMDLPNDDDWQAIPASRLHTLEQLSLSGSANDAVTRGQYRSYRQEVDNETSNVETFVSLKLASSDPTWQGVPITLTAGKGLNDTLTEITIIYKKIGTEEPNVLILRIQPNEGVELFLWTKEPGYDRKLRQVPLSFSYSEQFEGLPEAYERVFVDAMKGDRSLFTSSDEVLASWKILKPVQENWKTIGDQGLIIYESGSKPGDVVGTITAKD